jgi:hypothetical protein
MGANNPLFLDSSDEELKTAREKRGWMLAKEP